MMPHTLGDDGTLDTVAVCTECGEEIRYTYNPVGTGEDDYQEFVKWVLQDAADSHTCDDTLPPL